MSQGSPPAKSIHNHKHSNQATVPREAHAGSKQYTKCQIVSGGERHSFVCRGLMKMAQGFCPLSGSYMSIIMIKMNQIS